MSCQICSKTLGLKKSCKCLKERVKERRYRQKKSRDFEGGRGWGGGVFCGPENSGVTSFRKEKEEVE